MADKDPWAIKPHETNTTIGQIKRLAQIAERLDEPEIVAEVQAIKQSLIPDHIWISDFVPMTVDDMAAIGIACKEKAARVSDEYRCIVEVVKGGFGTSRCGLPRELTNLSVEELEEQRIPWGNYAWTFATWSVSMQELAEQHHPMRKVDNA